MLHKFELRPCSSGLNLTHICCLPRPSAKTVPRRLTITPGCWPAIPLRSGLPHKELIHTKIRRFRNIHRSEEHTSELQSLMRISYAVFCLKKKNNTTTIRTTRSLQDKP